MRMEPRIETQGPKPAFFGYSATQLLGYSPYA